MSLQLHSVWLVAVTVLATLPVADAQAESLYAFEMTLAENGKVTVPYESGAGRAEVIGTIRDISNVPPYGLLPAGSSGVPVFAHRVSLKVTPIDIDSGWQVSLPVPNAFDVFPHGPERTFKIPVLLSPQAQSPFFRANITATIQIEDGTTRTLTSQITAFTPGLPVFNVQGAASKTLGLRESFSANVTITNLDLKPRPFTFALDQNPCGFSVGTPGTVMVNSKDSTSRGIGVESIKIQAPASGFFPLGEQCQISVRVFPSDEPGNVRPVFFSVTLQGVGVEPPLIFAVLLAIALLVLLILFLRRRKEKLEEEILGKPQKPWTIPVEKVYLKALKAKDERAWYVVRHFLMEEEYRSALLWYTSYKKATKGTRKRERLVLRQEKQYARWKAAWARAIAKPMKKADRFEAKLQAKLDRKAKKAHRKEVKKWKALVAKLQEATQKQVERAEARYAKDLKRAQKKGLAEPERPFIAAPDLPPEPRLAATPLAGTRLGKKAERFRRKMAKRQGNLEVKFEKADARRLSKVERKVDKLARKLDDPAFVAEHPMLARRASRTNRA